MADRNWRQNPEIQEAQRVCKALGKTAVMVIWLDETTGQYGGASYGTNGPRCRAVAPILDLAIEEIAPMVSRLMGRRTVGNQASLQL